MSVPGSSSTQVQQNHNRMAILEDLQEKKKRMRMQSTGPGSSSSLPMKDSSMRMTREEAHSSALKQQQALQHAHENSSAYFITQDSSFGNLILPVIPRLPAPPE
ncbi:SOSS complex subunit C-like [Diadema setosum]|uniref:SOSS complex subunit C-like n=1 Tax=Diadema setosum TaxID=31175 RepID=UPI003B3AA638